MFRDYQEDKLKFLKLITEANLDPEMLSTLSNPALSIRNWDGKGEMPTTVKSEDMDAIIKKIAYKEGENGAEKAQVFESMYEEIFGKSEKSEYRPYESLVEDSYRDSFIDDVMKDSVKFNKAIRLAEAEDMEDAKEDKSNDKDLDFGTSELKKQNDDSDEEDDDDDDEEDDDNLNESYMGLNLDEDDNVEDILKEDTSYNEVAPISLLVENSNEDLINLNSLLEQTQLIEDEIDSILNYSSDDLSGFSDVISESDELSLDNFSEQELLENFGDLVDDDVDYSNYLDEDLM